MMVFDVSFLFNFATGCTVFESIFSTNVDELCMMVFLICFVSSEPGAISSLVSQRYTP